MVFLTAHHAVEPEVSSKLIDQLASKAKAKAGPPPWRRARLFGADEQMRMEDLRYSFVFCGQESREWGVVFCAICCVGLSVCSQTTSKQGKVEVSMHQPGKDQAWSPTKGQANRSCGCWQKWFEVNGFDST